MTSTTAQNVAQAKPQVKTTTSYLLCLRNYESLLRFKIRDCSRCFNAKINEKGHTRIMNRLR